MIAATPTAVLHRTERGQRNSVDGVIVGRNPVRWKDRLGARMHSESFRMKKNVRKPNPVSKVICVETPPCPAIGLNVTCET
jgi:hypothetical protein